MTSLQTWIFFFQQTNHWELSPRMMIHERYQVTASHKNRITHKKESWLINSAGALWGKFVLNQGNIWDNRVTWCEEDRNLQMKLSLVWEVNLTERVLRETANKETPHITRDHTIDGCDRWSLLRVWLVVPFRRASTLFSIFFSYREKRAETWEMLGIPDFIYIYMYW